MELNEITKEITSMGATSEQKGYLSMALMLIAFISRMLTSILSEYDTWFKVLSILSLILVCLVNGTRLLEQVINGIKKLYVLIKEFKNKK